MGSPNNTQEQFNSSSSSTTRFTNDNTDQLLNNENTKTAQVNEKKPITSTSQAESSNSSLLHYLGIGLTVMGLVIGAVLLTLTIVIGAAAVATLGLPILIAALIITLFAGIVLIAKNPISSIEDDNRRLLDNSGNPNPHHDNTRQQSEHYRNENNTSAINRSLGTGDTNIDTAKEIVDGSVQQVEVSTTPKPQKSTDPQSEGQNPTTAPKR